MYRLTRGRLPHLGRWTRWLLALTCALCAAVSAVDARAVRREPAAAVGVPVVIAARNLPAGRLLTRGDLIAQRMPAALVPTGTRAGPGQLTGHRLAGPVLRHEPITSARLLGSDLTAGLPRGAVAVAVAVDRHGAELVHPGDRVDLVAAALSGDITDGSAPDTTAGQVVVTRVLVLANLPPSGTDAALGSAATLVVAADRATAVRVSRVAATHDFTALVVAP